MKSLLLIPLLAGALLFSGCGATVVDSRPYGRSYSGGGYYGRPRDDYHHSRFVYSTGRRGYYRTQPVYATPYGSRPSYGRTREINRVAVVSPRVQLQRKVVKETPSRHHKKKKSDGDHR